MKRKFLLGGILASIGLLVLIAGCAIGRAPDEEQAMVEVTISGSGIGAKTILPDVTMEIDYYMLEYWEDVDGTHYTKGPYYGSSTTAYLLLKPGDYYFKAMGYNEDPVRGDILIGEGETGPVEVFSKEVTSQQQIGITVIPLSGKGALDVTVKWTEIEFENPPKVTGEIQDLDGNRIGDPITFEGPQDNITLPANRYARYYTDGTSGKDLLDAGYYKFYVKMTNSNDDWLWSTREALRIVQTDPIATSEKTYELVQELYGLVAVAVTANLENPLLVKFYIVPYIYDSEHNPVPGPVQIFDQSNDDVVGIEHILGYSLSVNAFVYDEDGKQITEEGDPDRLQFEWWQDGDVPITPGGGTTPGVNSKVYINTGAGYHWLDLLVTWTTDSEVIVSSRRVKFTVLN